VHVSVVLLAVGLTFVHKPRVQLSLHYYDMLKDLPVYKATQNIYDCISSLYIR